MLTFFPKQNAPNSFESGRLLDSPPPGVCTQTSCRHWQSSVCSKLHRFEIFSPASDSIPVAKSRYTHHGLARALECYGPQSARSPDIRDFPSCAAIGYNRSLFHVPNDRGVVMANRIQRKEIGGERIHVRDCYVWTEIYYLDSRSDYREYLPQDRHRRIDGHGLEMLDTPRQSLRTTRDLSVSLAVFFLFAGLIACLLFYPVLR